MLNRRTAVVVFCCVLLCGAGRVSAGYYVATNLGTLGGTTSNAYNINDHGQVVGRSTNGDGYFRAFLYDGGVMQDLGTLGGLRSYGYGINNDGQVVGYAENEETPTRTRAFRYDSGGGMQSLGTLGGVLSYAYAINNSGQVVGYSQNAGGTYLAYIYNSGSGMQPIGTLGGTSYAEDINDHGQVVGYSPINPGISHAFIYDGTNGIQDLDPAGAYSSYAYGINNAGQVVGNSSKLGSTRGFIYDGGETQILGTLGGTTSLARNINDAGQVVGYSQNLAGDTHAFVYGDGQMIDLNEVVDPGLGWTLVQAIDINARGQIVGYGRITGETGDCGFLLTPALPGDANLDGTVNLLDLAELGANWHGADKTWFQGDFNDDGVVNLLDLAELGQNWHATILLQRRPGDDQPEHSSARAGDVRPARHGADRFAGLRMAEAEVTTTNNTEDRRVGR